MSGDAITTAEAFAVLDEKDLSELVLLESSPALADELATQFAETYCRSIEGFPAEVVALPASMNHLQILRRAA